MTTGIFSMAADFVQASGTAAPAWACAVLGAIAGGFAAYAYRLLPARWLCDYGETPQARHAADRRRLSVWAAAAMALLCALCTVGLVGGGAQTDTAGSTGASGAAFFAPSASAGAGKVSVDAAVFSQPLAGLLALLSAVCAACLVAALLLAAVCDAQYTILPDQLLGLAGAFALLLWALGGLRGVHSAWYSPFLGAALGLVCPWALLVLAGKMYRTEAVGFGDVKLLAVLGALCGPRALGVAALLAVLAGGVILGAMLLCGKINRRSMVAFGPFLVGGALAAVCLWPQWRALGNWYLALFGL